MSNPEDKEKRSKRLHKEEGASKKQQKMALRQLFVRQPEIPQHLRQLMQ